MFKEPEVDMKLQLFWLEIFTIYPKYIKFLWKVGKKWAYIEEKLYPHWEAEMLNYGWFGWKYSLKCQTSDCNGHGEIDLPFYADLIYMFS